MGHTYWPTEQSKYNPRAEVLFFEMMQNDMAILIVRVFS